MIYAIWLLAAYILQIWHMIYQHQHDLLPVACGFTPAVNDPSIPSQDYPPPLTCDATMTCDPSFRLQSWLTGRDAGGAPAARRD